MIGMRTLTAGIAEYLSAATGVPAFPDRAKGAVYPCLTVETESRQAGVLACGRQVDRQVTVTVTCHPSRERTRQSGMLLADRVWNAVAAGFHACGRGFCPTDTAIRRDEQERVRVTFLLEFCDTPEEVPDSAPAVEAMGVLHLRVKKEGS
ncbi:MAG: hypothetical protein IJA84_05230 [Clostridia bacterium]|nr:hypothetical protein [Clostridia bacterium]